MRKIQWENSKTNALKSHFLHLLFIHLDYSELNMQIYLAAFCNVMRIKFDF